MLCVTMQCRLFYIAEGMLMPVVFKGCSVYVYDLSGKLVVKTTVLEHNVANSAIILPSLPELEDQARYNLMILCDPSPYSFSCLSEIKEDIVTFVLIKGDVREQRSHIRYAMSGTVSVSAYLYEGKAFALHTPQDAGLVNISKGGMRLRMKPNSLSLDDMVHICLDIGEKKRVLSAHVVNLFNTDDNAEYGCELLAS